MMRAPVLRGLGVTLTVMILGLLVSPRLGVASSSTTVSASDPQVESVARSVVENGNLRIQQLFLATRGEVELDLQRFTVFTQDAVILAGQEQLAVPQNVYFRGVVVGIPGSRAVMSFKASGAIDGLIVGDGEMWQVSSRAQLSGLAGQRLDPLEENADRPFECQTGDLVGNEPLDELFESSTDTPSVNAVDYSYSARVAVETDWEFLNKFGGDVGEGTDYVGDLFAFSSAIYEDEVDTSLYISFLRWWPGANNGVDPWTQSGCSGALQEFRTYWNSNQGGTERTVAHLMSGKSTGCGIAYVGVLCNSSYGYGLTGSLSGNFNPLNPLSSSGFWDIMAVSHEIGHNFGSNHTHCYNGILGNPDPVDECYNDQSGCYSGPESLPGCSPGGRCGTIMSYCHLRSGGYGNIALTFGQDHAFGEDPWRVPTVMNNHVVSRAQSYPSCLSVVIPSLIFEGDFESGTTAPWVLVN